MGDKIKEAEESIKKDSDGSSRRWANQYRLIYTDEVADRLADELLDWFQGDVNNLWFKDFFLHKHISWNTIGRLKKRNSYFAWIYDICTQLQESRLINLGMGIKNPALVILILKSNHGWKDKQEKEQTNVIKIIRDDIAGGVQQESGGTKK